MHLDDRQPPIPWPRSCREALYRTAPVLVMLAGQYVGEVCGELMYPDKEMAAPMLGLMGVTCGLLTTAFLPMINDAHRMNTDRNPQEDGPP